MLEFRWLPIAIIKSELCNAKFAPLWPAIPGDPRFNISSESNASKFDHVTTYGILVFLINFLTSKLALDKRIPFPATIIGLDDSKRDTFKILEN